MRYSTISFEISKRLNTLQKVVNIKLTTYRFRPRLVLRYCTLYYICTLNIIKNTKMLMLSHF